MTVLDSRMTVLDSRVTILDSRVTILDSKIAVSDSKMIILDSKMAVLDSKMAILDSKIGVKASFLRYEEIFGIERLDQYRQSCDRCRSGMQRFYEGSMCLQDFFSQKLTLNPFIFILKKPFLGCFVVRMSDHKFMKRDKNMRSPGKAAA
jgi:hypothetical protein